MPDLPRLWCTSFSLLRRAGQKAWGGCSRPRKAPVPRHRPAPNGPSPTELSTPLGVYCPHPGMFPPRDLIPGNSSAAHPPPPRLGPCWSLALRALCSFCWAHLPSVFPFFVEAFSNKSWTSSHSTPIYLCASFEKHFYFFRSCNGIIISNKSNVTKFNLLLWIGWPAPQQVGEMLGQGVTTSFRKPAD